MNLKFTVHSKDTTSQGRVGEFTTSHGKVQTPVFMPVGTQACVKALGPDEVAGLGYKMILGNTYHLFLRPGHEVIRSLGGLHKFMSWDGGILTDSGGFQVFSLEKLVQVSDEGVRFASHLDGAKTLITPEKCVEIQEAFGSDIIMVLDQMSTPGDSEAKVIEAAERSLAWAGRSVEARTRDDCAMFGIVQGGCLRDLRVENARQLAALPFDGYAIGGLSVGEPKEIMSAITGVTANALPEDKPRYLMGVGTPDDLVVFASMGVDMFDCVMPTRNARNGAVFTSSGKLNIKNAGHTGDDSPLDRECCCMACSRFSRAYIRHLFMAGEILAMRLLTLHNLAFYHRRMEMIKDAIENGSLGAWAEDIRNSGTWT